MSKEALRLADALTPPKSPEWVMHIQPQWSPNREHVNAAAAELRRLAASEQRLVGALELVRMSRGWQYMADETRDVIDAAIAAAKEQQ